MFVNNTRDKAMKELHPHTTACLTLISWNLCQRHQMQKSTNWITPFQGNPNAGKMKQSCWMSRWWLSLGSEESSVWEGGRRWWRDRLRSHRGTLIILWSPFLGDITFQFRGTQPFGCCGRLGPAVGLPGEGPSTLTAPASAGQTTLPSSFCQEGARFVAGLSSL